MVCENQNKKFQLIVTIVDKGYSGKVVDASKDGGAEGGTILHGRGSGVHEKAKFFGITVEPEKEIVLTLVKEEICDEVITSITEKVGLNKPGKGIAFVIDVARVAGICHLEKVLNKDFN